MAKKNTDNNAVDPKPDNLLSTLPDSISKISKIKLGPGILGKRTSMDTTTMLVLGTLAMALIIRGGTPGMVIASVISAAIIYINWSYKIDSVKIAREFPTLALMESGEINEHRRLELRYQAMNPSVVTIDEARKIETEPSLPQLPSGNEIESEDKDELV
jgi:hypothetical protein